MMMKRLYAAAALLSCVACVHPLVPAFKQSARDTNKPMAKIMVVQSGANSLFKEPVDALMRQTEYQVIGYVLGDSIRPETFRAAVRREQPAAIVVLGLRAAILARDNVPEIPVVYAMVPNYKAYGFQTHRNFAGVSLEMPPASDFMQFKLVAPQVSKTGVFYSKDSAEFVKNAETELVSWGVTITAMPVSNTQDIKQSYEAHKHDIDSIWLQNDPVVMNNEAFLYLLGATRQAHQPMLAALSERLAAAGAVATVSVDFVAVGSQLAIMVHQIVDENMAPADIGVQDAVGGRLTVNLDAAALIDLQIPSEALPLIHNVISSRQADDARAH